MKYFFLCFSTSWKMVFYGIQISEKLFSMLFRFWKENFYAFHLLEKVIFMVFSLHFSVFCMLGPSLMNQNKFSLEVINAVVARVLFSSCWDILWCIKSNFLLKYCIQWLQDYCFPHVGTFSDEPKPDGTLHCWMHQSELIFFWSIVCSDGKSTNFFRLAYFVINQNEISF